MFLCGARKDCAMSDLNKLLDWLETHNQFVSSSFKWHSLSTEEGYGVNYDAAEGVGSI